jgi:hypothetical protein
MYCKACNKKLDSIYEGMVHGCLSPDIAERDRYKEALERIASGNGFVAIGSFPDDMWGEELKARMEHARKALEGEHGND